MASVDIPDDVMPRIVSALCHRGGYQQIDGGPTPEEFARKAVGDWLAQTVLQVEKEQAYALAEASLQPMPDIAITTTAVSGATP
jgi:hypothetical protein